MKLTVTDTRYGDRGVTVVDNGDIVRLEHRTDDRHVSVWLEPDELADMPSTGSAHTGVTLRPERISLRWHRGHGQYQSGSFKEKEWTSERGDHYYDHDYHEEWTLTSASVYGRNVKADGELGKLDLAAGFAFRDDRPELLQQLIDQHDPVVNGWPLEEEPV